MKPHCLNPHYSRTYCILQHNMVFFIPGATDEIFQLTRSVFRFHVEICILLFPNMLYMTPSSSYFRSQETTLNCHHTDAAKKIFVNHSIFSHPNPLLCLTQKTVLDGHFLWVWQIVYFERITNSKKKKLGQKNNWKCEM